MVYGENLGTIDVGKRYPAPETGAYAALPTGEYAPANDTTKLPVLWSVVYNPRANKQERLTEERFRIEGKKPVREMIKYIANQLPYVQAENAKNGVLNLANFWIMHEGRDEYPESVIRAIEKRLNDDKCMEELIVLVNAKKSRRKK